MCCRHLHEHEIRESLKVYFRKINKTPRQHARPTVKFTAFLPLSIFLNLFSFRYMKYSSFCNIAQELDGNLSHDTCGCGACRLLNFSSLYPISKLNDPSSCLKTLHSHKGHSRPSPTPPVTVCC